MSVGACLWGTDAVLRTPLTGVLSSAYIVLAEHLILTLLVLPLLWSSRRTWLTMTGREWLALTGIAWGGSALGTVLFTEAIRQGNPTSAVLLQKAQPLFAALLSGVLLTEPLGGGFWVRLILAIFGAWTIQFGFAVPRLASNVLPAFEALLAAALWGASTVLGRVLLSRHPPFTVAAFRITAALPLLTLLTWLDPVSHFAVPSPAQTGTLVLLALIPGLFGLAVYYFGLSRCAASRASVAELCFPATAVLLNWRFLGTSISSAQVVGFVVLSGTILSWQLRAPKRLDVSDL